MSTLSGGGAKELLPIGGKPQVLRVMEEISASGIDEVLIVSAPGKGDLENVVREAAGSPGMPRQVEVVIQEFPRGLADAIRLGRDFARKSALAVALPDNLFIGDAPALSQLIDVHRQTGKNVVAIVELTAANRDRYGPTAIYPGRVNGNEFIIDRIPDKGPRHQTFDPQGGKSAYTGVGRYVLLPDAFEAIDEVAASLRPGTELDDIPVLQLLLGRERLTGCVVQGDFLDLGIPSGYLEADRRFR
jgi:UTP--glucose-1-phosphate uridylyltransferase